MLLVQAASSEVDKVDEVFDEGKKAILAEPQTPT